MIGGEQREREDARGDERPVSDSSMQANGMAAGAAAAAAAVGEEEIGMVEERQSGGESPASRQQQQQHSPAISRVWRVFSAVNESTKWVATAATAAAVLAARNRAAAWFVIGAVANAANGKLLKRLLQHERPASARGRKVDPGMPSSHALSLAYLSIYGAIAGVQWHGVTTESIVAASLLVSLAGLLAILRVLLGLHTPLQVLVGWGMGACMAVLWWQCGLRLPLLPGVAPHAPLLDAAISLAGLVVFALFVLVEVRRWLVKASGGRMGGEAASR